MYPIKNSINHSGSKFQMPSKSRFLQIYHLNQLLYYNNYAECWVPISGLLRPLQEKTRGH